MQWLWNTLVGIITFIVSIFGGCQIIGSIRARHTRPIRLTAFTIILWLILLIAFSVIIHLWFYEFKTAYYIATVIGFILSLNAKTTA